MVIDQMVKDVWHKMIQQQYNLLLSQSQQVDNQMRFQAIKNHL